MEKAASRARLFVALDLPDKPREALVRWRERALAHPDLRLVAPEALHVTLVFLGYLPEERSADVAALIEPPAIGAPRLTACAVRALPPRMPRLFALDLDDEGGRAAMIQAALAGALEAAGLYEPEKRGFWPHLTLARVRKGARVRGVLPPPPPAAPWRASAITLYRSRLSPAGARYEPLHRVPLAE